MNLFGFFLRVTRNIDLLDRMIVKLGVRDRFASLSNGGEVLRRAAIRCMTCDQADACSAWLDANEKQIEAAEFCRNHDLFERVKHRIEADQVRA